MSTELIIAGLSGLVALASGGLAAWNQVRLARMSDELTRRRDEEQREREAEALVSKYREPLVRVAGDLQSRLYNIVEREFLQVYRQSSVEAERRYAIDNTLFVVADYMAWIEVIRREVQFLDLGGVEASRRFTELLDAVAASFLSDRPELGPHFRLFRGEQRAIGELMLEPQGGKGERRFDPIGFAEFSLRLCDEDFRRWFRGVESSLEPLAEQPESRRLITIQRALVDLIEFLDPEALRIPRKRRTKIDLPD